MKTAGIVAEFNPFHSGHAALIQAVRGEGATHVAAVMSGNFVQRGSLAITDKRVRAHCALLGGADLVLELPVSAATATAQQFARGAVGLLAATGCVDILCFGSESGDARGLSELARAVDARPVTAAMTPLLGQGLTFARARQLAVEQELGSRLGRQLGRPNNALGVEYLRAAHSLGWQPRIFTMARRGAAHDEAFPAPGGSYASASYLRTVAGDWDKLARFMPEDSVSLLRRAGADGLYPVDPARLETAVLAVLRGLSPEALAALPDLSEGLENRLWNAIRGAASLEELYAKCKTKRYTLARVRRLVLHAFLGITGEDVRTLPPYLRVLGFGHRGRELLARMADTATLPVGSRLTRLREAGPEALRFALLEERSTDLYTLAMPVPRPCGYELRASGVYLG